MSNWVETLGKTMSLRLAAWEHLGVLTEELQQVAVDPEGWSFLIKLLSHQSDSGPGGDGWIFKKSFNLKLCW